MPCELNPSPADTRYGPRCRPRRGVPYSILHWASVKILKKVGCALTSNITVPIIKSSTKVVNNEMWLEEWTYIKSIASLSTVGINLAAMWPPIPVVCAVACPYSEYTSHESNISEGVLTMKIRAVPALTVWWDSLRRMLRSAYPSRSARSPWKTLPEACWYFKSSCWLASYLSFVV